MRISNKLSVVLLLALISVLLEGCLDNGNSTNQQPSDTSSQATPSNGLDPKIQAQLDQLQQLNVAAATHWSQLGPGWLTLPFNVYFEDMLNFPNASCAQQSYLFLRTAMQTTGLYARQIGIFDVDGNNDVMVEVFINGQPYLFVPSSGVYYPFGMADLLNDPSLANQYIGTVLNGGQGYVSAEFFTSVSMIDIYPNSNDVEENFALDATASGQGLFPRPNDAAAAIDGNQSTYAAGLSSVTLPQTISLQWNNPQNIYRIWVDWINDDDASADFDVVLHKQDGTSMDIHYMVSPIAGLPSTQVVLPETVSIIGMDFIVNSAGGQDRLLIRELGVY